MGALWALIGVVAASTGLGIWLIVRTLVRRRKGRVFGLLGGLSVILVAWLLLSCYLGLIFLPDIAAGSAVFHRPAPVDGSATVFYLSPAAEPYAGTLHTSTDTLIAVAARTGAIRWQRGLPSVKSRYAVDGEIAYVTMPAADGITVAAYRAADGAALWQTAVPGSSADADIVVGGDAVYVRGAAALPRPQQAIVALRASDGAHLWSVGTGVDVYTLKTSIVAAPDVAYWVTTTGVQAYRARDGSPLWSRMLPSQADFVRPAVAGSSLYLPADGGGVSAVRAGDGSTLCATRDGLQVHAIAVAGSTLYVAAKRPGDLTDGQGTIINPEAVYAYDASTCARRWQYATKAINSADELIAGDEAAYVSADGGLTALRAADGRALWHRDVVNVGLQYASWTFAAQPAALGGTLFVTAPVLLGGIHVGATDGRVHLFAIGSDGADDWHVPVGHVTTFYGHWTL